MSKQSMYESLGRTHRGDGGEGGGESSSRTQPQQQQSRDGDYETALRLQKKLDEEARYSDQRRLPLKECPIDYRSQSKAAAPSSRTSSRDLAAAYPKEIQGALDEVQKFVTGVIGTTCRGCGRPLMRDFNVHRWFKQWTSTKGQPQPSSICSLTCPNKECQVLTCLGCGEKPRMGKFTGKIDAFRLDWCCESGRLVAIWSLLCIFDNLELAEKDRSRRHVQQLSRLPANVPSKKGTGYGDEYLNRHHRYFTAAETSGLKQADNNTDDSTKQILALVIELLPRRSEKSKAAPAVLGSLIELSLVQDRIAELLRNDSLRDTTARAELYFTVFEFFERLGKHPDTSYLICEERFVKKHSNGLFEISTSKDIKGKGKARENHHLVLGQGEDRMTASLLACMSNIEIQSEALLKASRAVKLKDEFRTAAAQDLLEVADRIAKLQVSMKPKSRVDSPENRSNSKSDREMTWKEYNQKYCVMREENVLRNMVDRLAREAYSLRHSPTNRIKRLVTEASEMETSLPPNIFIKVDEVRPDVMKCLIIGPEDTPYERGLFEFDIFCPVDYPLSPPAVVFRTTAEGTIEFNPNLHKDGKVCLSLLGTWPGPPESKWQGPKSSILSVLISIQALIFTPDPLENLPPGTKSGYKAKFALGRGESYKSLVQLCTVRYAMLDWLQKNDMRNGLWRDVVRKYFEHNGGAVLNVVNKWRGTNPLIQSYKEPSAPRPEERGDLTTMLVNAVRVLQQDRHH